MKQTVLTPQMNSALPESLKIYYKKEYGDLRVFPIFPTHSEEGRLNRQKFYHKRRQENVSLCKDQLVKG